MKNDRSVRDQVADLKQLEPEMLDQMRGGLDGNTAFLTGSALGVLGYFASHALKRLV